MSPLHYLRNAWADWRANVAHRQECRDAAAGLRKVAAGMGDNPARQERWIGYAETLEAIAAKAVV